MVTLLVAGLAAPAGAAPGVVSSLIEGSWEINGQPTVQDNNAFINITPASLLGFDSFLLGTAFVVHGTVRGVGTAGQVVTIDYGAAQPTTTSRDSTKATVRQSQFAVLNVSFDGVSATGKLIVQNCSVSGSVNTKTMTGSASLGCKGTDLFAVLNADQIASLQAAFNGRRDTKIKVNRNASKWSLSIACRGAATPD